jgi:hypothetical protein
MKSGLLFSLCASLIVGACSSSKSSPLATGDDGGPGDGGSALDLQKHCTAFWTKACAARQQCQAKAFGDWEHGDMANCIARESSACVAALSLGLQNTTPAQLDACDAAWDLSDCETYYDTLADLVKPAACQQASGGLADGSPCTVDWQCANLTCAMNPGLRCGTCVTRKAAGAACTAANACAYGLACVAGKCAAIGKKGDACGPLQPCGAELICQGTSAVAKPTCVDRLADGTACTVNAGQCLQEHFCDSQTNKCADPGTAKLGQPCGQVNADNLFVNCEAKAKCRIDDLTKLTGTCVTEIADGQSCTANFLFNGPCQWPAQCFDGTCQLSTSFSCSTPIEPIVKATVCSAAPDLMTPRKHYTFTNATATDAAIYVITSACAEDFVGYAFTNNPQPPPSVLAPINTAFRLRDPYTNHLLKEIAPSADTADSTISLP